MGRLVLNWVCVCALVALPVGGCSDETAASGGTGGDGGTGGIGAEGGTGGAGGGGGTGGIPECESPEDCDDGNECTGSACDVGMCEYPPVADGTACDEGNECSVGMCADGICPPVADDTVCGDDAGTCQQGSCRMPCTEQGIRDAIAAGGGPYTFDCDGPQTVVTEAEIVIDNDVILDGEGNLTVDGNDDHDVLFVPAGVTAELHGLRVDQTFDRFPTKSHDGIGNSGTLTLTNSTVSGNSDGIFNDGTMEVTSSTMSLNGRGIVNEGTMAVTNCTVSGNGGQTFGGGIGNSGTLTVTSTTVSGNTETCFGMCDFLSGVSGIYTLSGTATLTNSIVSGNRLETDVSVEDANCSGGLTSNGHNIESPGNTCGFDQEGDQVDVTEGELNLGPLQDNGGPTETHALRAGSVAIDLIPADMCEVDEDQRGEPRDSMCDVGAFEVQP